ncbi:tRNA guanosine-2'-O-methyltransferase, putative [Plasmodium knowlesi strain H]|uniref:tRNA guanosine-2'-O-methyltransferase, putative n=3 Tax=Plasmodium knowlesi TaxID=5850 RepID=A0A5K1TZ79_PLAKH|nr:uncharacterized protein PKNH_1258200 [Plasmodium knowlesi strain H]OTN66491.1 putative tRNA guanosine-2'-O-methyltransferase [Plasmodium knowlesi]CAA9989907.1 tRNA guanosine-2'-O-methyltransferase, putative [Plasmodium knowlesi strain H]SBO24474.1 tRNA guanosine-2'-O-methyltransferase, putative [Plasmodium knowlesi strain H]SBO26505.1 tRNA guanosine-2'-O-methyltransferase, putative [Plasmodium knowlesi strain H]VVS79381.1 tRNA guanosine-2'-O-methyltransferase, putative [Plasmodium knowlesi |eukprot:XP_002259923.1 [Plasmodium knowlesi strain H]
MLHLLWFSSHNKYDECKITELKSLLHIFGYKDEGEALLNDKNKHKGEVFVKVDLPEDIDWKSVISRSVLIKGIIQIWSEGTTYDDLLSDLLKKEYLFSENLGDKKWRFHFNSFGKIVSQNDKVKKMEHFKVILDKYPKVDLSCPEVELGLLEEYDKNNLGILKKIYFGKCMALRKNNKTLVYRRNDQGHMVNDVRTKKTQLAWWIHYSLNKRPVLGPTTTDNELAFLMCNIAKVKAGHIVLDPFVGSGGLLITSSIFNAICVGNDIDIRLLKGYKIAYLNPHMQHKSRNKNIFENFLHYNLSLPEILVSDNSKPVWNAFHKPWVDAIVTDPPYGNRATVRICLRNANAGDSIEGSTPANEVTLPGGDNTDNAHNHDRWDFTDKDGDGCPPHCDNVDSKRVKSLMNTKTVTYSCTEAVKDLLNIASITLVDNGMLVFLLPVQLDNFEEEIAILKHDDFFLISYDLQTFTPCSGRLIVSMQRKCRNPSN